MTDSLAEAICYNMPESNAKYSCSEISEAVEHYFTIPKYAMRRRSLLNVALFYKEENERLRRQIDILMEHDPT